MTLPALLDFPWMVSRIPARIAVSLPRSLGRASRIDALTGDLIPAITIDVPMQIADLLAGSDTLALASLALMERDLDAGNVAVVRAVDAEIVRREESLESRYDDCV